MVESEVKEDFVKHIAATLDWGALCKAASEARYLGLAHATVYILWLNISVRLSSSK